MQAWVADLNGRIIGIGGLMFAGGRWFGFCDLTDEMRQHKFAIARTGKKIMDQARRQGIRFVYAERDAGEARSEHWLHSLGYEHDPRTNFYRWRAS